MVDQELLARVMRLDVGTRRELRDAIDESLPVEIAPELAAFLDDRIAQADAHPEERVPWEVVRAHGRATITAKKTA